MARSLVLGAGLGLATRLVYHGPVEFLWLHKLGVPWLAAAFLVGALRRSPRSGALHGAAALLAAVLVYYAIPQVVHGHYSHSSIGMAWSWVALPTGAAFGALGALWRSGGPYRVVSATILLAALLGEAALWYGRGRPAAALFEYSLAALLLGLLVPRASERAVVALGAVTLGLVAAGTELAVLYGLGYLVG